MSLAPTSATDTPPTIPLRGALPLPHLGVIQAQGDEAEKFLQGQLTQDVVLQGTAEARLAAYCSPKGRMLASFVVIKRAPGDLLLVCGRDILPATLKRLSMFVMRAKLRLSDASDAFQVWGLAGADAGADAPAAPWQVRAGAPGAQAVRLYPGAGVQRVLWIAAADQPAPAGERLSEADWAWLEVRSGVAPISQPIVEAFVPQMLNYESIGGVNFKKGCYPGQEVVARSQFRGTLKRRAYLLHSAAALAVGQEVFQAGDTEQPCGTVAAAAPHPAGGWEAIASLQTGAAAAGVLQTGDGAPLTLLPLPYALLDDI